MMFIMIDHVCSQFPNSGLQFILFFSLHFHFSLFKSVPQIKNPLWSIDFVKQDASYESKIQAYSMGKWSIGAGMSMARELEDTA